MVAGLETHIELSTKTKIFCGCTTAFGSEPNTHCCPICIGLPGTLPKLNRQAVRYAIMAGLATNCHINEIAKMDRKNYVYPDLPKAYQISQYDKPLCQHGYIQLESGRKIRIARIHIEEDAGKLVHERGDTFVDYNRGGVPLIEVVTEPDIRSIDEAREYVEKLALIMKTIGVSDCRMQEGSLRCDVNISLRPAGSETLGTRAEIKNMNSFTFMAKAMEYEMERQADLLDSGEEVVQETRRYNTQTGCTESMRSKEDAQDYRYFREPDLVTIATSPEEIEELRAMLPELPDARMARYEALGLAKADASLLVKYPRVAGYFDQCAQGLKNPKNAANLILGQMLRLFPTDGDKEAFQPPIPAGHVTELCSLMDEGKVKAGKAKNLMDEMLETGKPVSQLISPEDLAGLDENALADACAQAIAANPKMVSDYLGGKEKVIGALIGAVMKATKGKADPSAAQELLIRLMRQG